MIREFTKLARSSMCESNAFINSTPVQSFLTAQTDYFFRLIKKPTMTVIINRGIAIHGHLDLLICV